MIIYPQQLLGFLAPRSPQVKTAIESDLSNEKQILIQHRDRLQEILEQDQVGYNRRYTLSMQC